MAPAKDTTVCTVSLGCINYSFVDIFSRRLRSIGYDPNVNEVISIHAKSDNKVLATIDSVIICEANVVISAVSTHVTKAKNPEISCVIPVADGNRWFRS